MAATRLITMHQNKGKSVAKSLSDRTDCAKNGEKTVNCPLCQGHFELV